jgi:hypothetical protein
VPTIIEKALGQVKSNYEARGFNGGKVVCKPKVMNSQKVITQLSVHGSIPHHERKIIYFYSLSSVRPEVYPPSAAPASQRLVKGDQGTEG